MLAGVGIECMACLYLAWYSLGMNFIAEANQSCRQTERALILPFATSP